MLSYFNNSSRGISINEIGDTTSFQAKRHGFQKYDFQFGKCEIDFDWSVTLLFGSTVFHAELLRHL
jgi:hypothetical protein